MNTAERASEATNSDEKPRIRAEDIRQLADRKSLVHPLSYLADDFREQIRLGLRAKGHQIQTSQAKVLVHLDLQGTRLTDLANRAGISKQAMGKLVDELEKLGYVCRASHEDGRAKTIQFTEAGLALLQDSSDIVDSVWEEYSDLIGANRLLRFQVELQNLFSSVKKQRG